MWLYYLLKSIREIIKSVPANRRVTVEWMLELKVSRFTFLLEYRVSRGLRGERRVAPANWLPGMRYRLNIYNDGAGTHKILIFIVKPPPREHSITPTIGRKAKGLRRKHRVRGRTRCAHFTLFPRCYLPPLCSCFFLRSTVFPSEENAEK